MNVHDTKVLQCNNAIAFLQFRSDWPSGKASVRKSQLHAITKHAIWESLCITLVLITLSWMEACIRKLDFLNLLCFDMVCIFDMPMSFLFQ